MGHDETAEYRHRLRVLWDGLETFGANVHRRPINTLFDDELRALIAGETERLRVLQSPEARHHTLAARTAHRRAVA